MTDKFIQHQGNKGAYVNVDKSSYNAYYTQRKTAQKLLSENNEINILKDQINQVMQDQQDIKNMLIKLLENK
jgi:hypothetical protein